MGRYLTFPLVILKDFHVDIKSSLNDVMNYCLYERSLDKDGNQSERIEKARKEVGIKYPAVKKSYEEGGHFYNSIPTNSPKTSITTEIIFDYYQNSKTEFEIITFIAFAALRSILQRQGYCKADNQYLIGRMAGNNKKGLPISGSVWKYNNRYQLDKIKLELQLKWGLKLYAKHTRGFYFSFTMSLKDLIEHAEERRKKYKENELKRQKEEARIEALKTIYGTAYKQHL